MKFHTLVPRNAQQPSGEQGLATIVLEVLKGSKKCLLGHLFSVSVVSYEPASQPQNAGT
jgi:hypothetical protein